MLHTGPLRSEKLFNSGLIHNKFTVHFRHNIFIYTKPKPWWNPSLGLCLCLQPNLHCTRPHCLSMQVVGPQGSNRWVRHNLNSFAEDVPVPWTCCELCWQWFKKVIMLCTEYCEGGRAFKLWCCVVLFTFVLLGVTIVCEETYSLN